MTTRQRSTNAGVDKAVYCPDLAEYLDTSLQETGDALVDHPVSCSSLLTAAEMLSCNSTLLSCTAFSSFSLFSDAASSNAAAYDSA